MRDLFRAICLTICLTWAGVALAQVEPTAPTAPDYVTWDTVADRAEAAVDAATDETPVLESLRTRIADFRTQFVAGREVNAERITTLKAQIEALGPLPESGQEPADVAERRKALDKQLKDLQAPQQVADAAFRRADGLIKEIDHIIRKRQTRRLLALGPSPLNPLLWPAALTEFGEILERIGNETGSWRAPAGAQKLRDNLPLIVVLLVAGLLFLTRGRHWAGIALRNLHRLGGRGEGVWRFLVSLFRIFLPLAGVYALAWALELTGLAGVRINQLIQALPIWGAILLGFRWLAEKLFSRDEHEALIALPGEPRSEMRAYMLVLSLLFVARGVVALMFDFDGVTAATEAVLAFPIVVSMGLVLARMGLLIRLYRVPEVEGKREDTRGAGLARALRLVGTAMVLVALAAPVMAAIGYAEAGNALLYPSVVSLTILGLVIVLQRFAADVYCLVTGQGPQGREALVPVLMGFVLVMASAPVLALVWGARVAELTELWSSFARGFKVGDTQVSPTDFLTFALIFGLGYTLTRLVQGTLRSNVLPKTKIDVGGQSAIVSGIGYVGIFLAALVAITGAGIDLSSFAIVAGALSVGIGFGLQNIVNNFVSGIILLIERPISEGDWIAVGGQMGYVRDISVRSTRIETFDRTDVIVPNADLVSGTVTNYTRGNTIGRIIVKVGVAYGSDTRKVDAILREIAEAQPMVLANPAPLILFHAFGADALEFEIRAILRDVNSSLSVTNEINHAIAERFVKEGIEIPFAQRDIWLRNPEALEALKK